MGPEVVADHFKISESFYETQFKAEIAPSDMIKQRSMSKRDDLIFDQN